MDGHKVSTAFITKILKEKTLPVRHFVVISVGALDAAVRVLRRRPARQPLFGVYLRDVQEGLRAAHALAADGVPRRGGRRATRPTAVSYLPCKRYWRESRGTGGDR